MIQDLKLWKITSTLYKKDTIWEMIQNYKDGETVQCTSKQKVYLRLPQEYGILSLAT